MHQEFITKEKTKTSTINIGQVSIYFEYTEMNVLFKCNFKLTVRELQLKKTNQQHTKKNKLWNFIEKFSCTNYIYYGMLVISLIWRLYSIFSCLRKTNSMKKKTFCNSLRTRFWAVRKWFAMTLNCRKIYDRFAHTHTHTPKKNLILCCARQFNAIE